MAEIKIGPFGSLLHKEDYIANGHALVNPSHIVAGKISVDKELTVSDEKFRELSAYHLQVGDVVMGRRGEMGRCAVVQTGGLLCGTGSILIRTKGEVTADYLQKIISFPSFKKGIEDMAVGQTMPNLNVPIVSKFQIIQPPIEVQNAYYTFVEQTDKSRFIELFGDPVINPKRFPCYTVGEVIDFQGGSQPDKKYFEYEASPDNIRLIQIRDYKSDKYITYIPKTMAKRFCTADDIMIGRYGPPIFQILKGIEGSFNVALMKATPKIGNKEFVRQFLKQDCLLEYLEGLSKRTAGQDGIQMDKLKAYPFPYPPIELQEQFAAFVEQTDKSKYYSSLSFRYCQAAENAYRQEWITCRTSDF